LIFQNHYNIKLTFVKKRKEYLMKKMRLKKTMVYTLIILSIPCFLFASDPANTFTFQGVLQDSDGVPISSTVNMVFKIYDSSDNILWTETKPVQIISGEFHLLLGKSVSNPIGFTVNEQARYIGVAVDGDPEMSPRQEVGGVLRAGVALSVTDNAISASKIADNAIAPLKLAGPNGAALTNGMNGQVLISNGDGTFRWGSASTTYTDQEAVVFDKSGLDITYASGDTSDAVTQDFSLSDLGSYGSSITWSESFDTGNNVVVSGNNVTVTRPSAGSGDAEITLLATITKSGQSDTKEFTMTISQLFAPGITGSVEVSASSESSFPASGIYGNGFYFAPGGTSLDLYVVDVRVKSAPVLQAILDLPDVTASYQVPKKMEIVGNNLYVPMCDGPTLAVFDITDPSTMNNSTTPTATISLSSLGSWARTVVADDTDTYLYIGNTGGSNIGRVTVADNTFTLLTPASGSFEAGEYINYKNGYLYGHGSNTGGETDLCYYDISGNTAGLMTSAGSSVYSIEFYGNYMFIGLSGSVKIFEMTNPTTNVLSSSHSGTGYDIDFTGTTAVINTGGTNISTLDISNIPSLSDNSIVNVASSLPGTSSLQYMATDGSYLFFLDYGINPVKVFVVQLVE
jgi:hypothetical protein